MKCLVLNGISAERLADRRQLRTAFDNFRRDCDATGKMAGIDVFTERAIGILSSPELFNALDVSQEDPVTRQRYGEDDETKPKGDDAPRCPQNFLVARRLVEAGARVVTINYSFWDWHGNNFNTAREEFPVFEKALTALVEDLHTRGMDQNVTVIAWGEFGRTPKINKNAGRDHWARASCALMAGGKIRGDQVVGGTDAKAEGPVDSGFTPDDLAATFFHSIGIDPKKEYQANVGRPITLVRDGSVINDLVQ